MDHFHVRAKDTEDKTSVEEKDESSQAYRLLENQESGRMRGRERAKKNHK